MYSKEHLRYLKNIKKRKRLIFITQILIGVIFLLIWELLSRYKIINPFIYSSPSLIIKTIIKLYNTNNLFNHIFITIYETILGFTISTLLGLIIASILWWNDFIYKVIDPYLTIINSMPKVALGPIIIILFGANINSIIIMSLLISLIITIINIYNGFNNTDNNKIKLLKSFNASKCQIFKYLIIPSNYITIINTLKINISMCLIGIIMGEFLVSKKGLGYIIMYGSQVFNLNLVMTGIIILLLVSIIMYKIVSKIEKILIKNN